jgi:IS4 transposase
VVLKKIVERFTKKSPVAAMTHLILERALDEKWVNEIFEKNSSSQYTRTLMFSTVVDVMALVALRLCPSPHAAVLSMEGEINVSKTAVYDKINGVEPAVVRSLVREGAERFIPLIKELKGKGTATLNGFRLLVVDGNHHAATEKRLKKLRKLRGAALPAQSLVVYDPDLELIVDVLPWKDAHDQERVLMQYLLERAVPGDLWMADRNFCTAPIIIGLIKRGAHFLVREHGANPNPKEVTKLRKIGRIETGMVYEQIVSIQDDGVVYKFRRIEIRLKKPTEDGDLIIRLLTNAPSSKLTAKKAARMYRLRWTIEAMFQRLESVVASEVTSLGMPCATLLAFGVASFAYNVLSLVKVAIRSKHASFLEKEGVDLSPYYIGLRVRESYVGLLIATEESDWAPYRSLSDKEFANVLLDLAGNLNPLYLRTYPRKPKVATKKGYVSRAEAQAHVATSRVLEAA